MWWDELKLDVDGISDKSFCIHEYPEQVWDRLLKDAHFLKAAKAAVKKTDKERQESAEFLARFVYGAFMYHKQVCKERERGPYRKSGRAELLEFMASHAQPRPIVSRCHKCRTYWEQMASYHLSGNLTPYQFRFWLSTNGPFCPQVLTEVHMARGELLHNCSTCDSMKVDRQQVLRLWNAEYPKRNMSSYGNLLRTWRRACEEKEARLAKKYPHRLLFRHAKAIRLGHVKIRIIAGDGKEISIPSFRFVPMSGALPNTLPPFRRSRSL